MPWFVGVLVVLAGSSSARAQAVLDATTLTDEHVRLAQDAIINELYARKAEGHFWDPASWPQDVSKTQTGGFTALAVLALVYAGESYQDPRLSDAVEHLQRFDMNGTYALSIRAALWARLPDRFLENLEKDVTLLIEGFNEETGCWDYTRRFRKGYHDNSLRQFGALALWEAAKRGGRIDPRIWTSIEDHLIAVQLDNGAWNYNENSVASGSMTTAGLATMFITQDYLHAAESLPISNRVSLNQQSIDRGLAWLEENFSPSENPGIYREYYYYMYGVERVGLASGRKYFGGHDWFLEGAVEIINRLCKWDPARRTMTVHQKVGGKGNAALVRLRHLAFGLMFLSRGRVPVAINKLKTPNLAWNNRPRDAANLATWISQRSESPVNWQIVDLGVEPEQWLDAPMLYLASSEAVPWLPDGEFSVKSYVRDLRDFHRKRAAGAVPADAAPPVKLELPVADKIRRYLDLGGLLLAVNESSSKRFAKSVEQLGQIMYPQYEWRNLPADHWAYTIHEPIRRGRPPLMGLSNGVRELIILSHAGDLPRTLQGRDEKKESQFQTLSNIYFYASEMDRPRPRLARHADELVEENVKTTSQATLVRAMHEGNWNAEPLALEFLRRHLARERMIDLTIVERALATIDTMSPRPEVVLVSGVDRHEFSPAEQSAMTAYVNAGGVLLFETAGGLGEFTLSAEEMATQLLGGEIQSTLLTPIITGEKLKGAPDLTRLEYRPYSLLEAFGARETTPRLRCLLIGGAPRVLFSREDLSHALLDQGVWGVSGYTTESALNLLGNVIQYARSIAQHD